ncbi:hypothetical protein AB6B38_04410 [Glycocaulis abyssi]|uniref:Uncharacterized protein n=1 Tax=Glycocaulis abyssi TaxID=1433403 RepID=A0ABV9N7R9_9PROT
MKRFAAALLSFALLAPCALAAPPSAPDNTSALVVPNDLRDLVIQAGERLAPPDTPHLDLPSITVPLVENGRLAGYAFLNARLHLDDEARIPEIRAQLHFMVHDMVALAHAHPFTLVSRDDFTTGDTYAHWDRALTARLGPGVVTGLEPLAGGVRLLRRYR